MSADQITGRAIQAGAAQKRAEFFELVKHVEALQPKVVVEIGTMCGGTLRAWCDCAAHDALIVSIDLPGGEWGGGYQPSDVPRLRGYAKQNQRLVLIPADSHQIETCRDLHDCLQGPVDFLFIDGDHSYEGAKADFEDYSQFVRPGGWIAFHDIVDHPNVPGCDVNLLWGEIRDRYETQEFVVPGDERHYGPWGGIGLLRWPG